MLQHCVALLLLLMQDVNVFVSEIDAQVDERPFQHDIVLGSQRQAYLVCIEGCLGVGSVDQGAWSVVDLAIFRVKLNSLLSCCCYLDVLLMM